MALDRKGDFVDVLGADALNNVLANTEVAAYRGATRGIVRGARIVRKAVRKRNFAWQDDTGRLRKSVRLAKVKGFSIRAGGRNVRVKPYATVVFGFYSKSKPDIYSPHAHLIARGHKTRGNRRVPGKDPLERALIANFGAVQAAVQSDFGPDFEKEMEKEIRRVYRGQLRKLLRGERTL